MHVCVCVREVGCVYACLCVCERKVDCVCVSEMLALSVHVCV